MVAGPGKTNAVSLLSGVGRVRAGTISIGSHVIAIENIGTIRIVRGRRTWWLFFLGVIIAGGAATQLNAHGAIAIAGIGLGIALVLGNLAQRVESGLAIGASDGCTTLIASRDQSFLQRLLQLLVDRIDSGDHRLAADFDIARGVLVSPTPDAAHTDHVIFADPPSAEPPAPAPEKSQIVQPPVALDESADEALFGDPAPEVPASAPAVTPAVKTDVPPPMATPIKAEKRQTFDRLLDGGPRPASRDDDWLVRQGPAPASPEEFGGGFARVLLALLIVTVLGGGVFAAWYFTGETGPSTSIPAIDISVQASAEPPVETPATETADSLQLPLAEPSDPEPPLAAEPAATPVPEPVATVEDFSPPAPMVARASGQRYRASPFMDDDVAVLAETRAGGEVLNITGRLMQSDGEWYRVLLADGRNAWFKSSLAIARTRFAGWVRPAATGPDASFAGSIPQVLEPSEGIALGGGPQFVTLDWSHREDASIFIVEIQAFDAEALRWIEDPLHKRTTVEGDTALAEMFASTGAWRWRVRGVTLDGQQSQFSRWSAFSIRD